MFFIQLLFTTPIQSLFTTYILLNAHAPRIDQITNFYLLKSLDKNLERAGLEPGT